MSTDALSEVLSAVHLSGSVFFDVTATAPWVAEAPPAAQIASAVMPGAQHTIEYHVVTRGSCWISLVGDVRSEPMRLQQGDIAVVPHGDPHVVSSEPGLRGAPILEIHRRPKDDNALPFKLRIGDEGPSDAHLICGFFSCDVRPFNPLLAALRALCGSGPTCHTHPTVCSTNSSASLLPKWGTNGRAARTSSTGFRN